MNGNTNMNVVNMTGMNINMAGLNNQRSAAMAAMIQNQNFNNPMVQQQPQGQSQQTSGQAGQQPQSIPGQNPQQVFGQNRIPFQQQQQQQQQQRMTMNPNGTTHVNGIPQQISHQQMLAQQQQAAQQQQQQQQQQAAQQHQQQQTAQQAASQQQPPRPGISRATTLQSGTPVQQKDPHNTNLMSAPSSAPLPTNNSTSAGNTRGHTPQMAVQSQPTSFNPQLQQGQQLQPGQKVNGLLPNNVTPIMASQQQPTPGGQRAALISQQQSQGQSQFQPAGQQAIGGQRPQGQQTPLPQSGTHRKSTAASPLSQPSTIPASNAGLAHEQDQIQNEMNSRVLKRNLGNAGAMRVLEFIEQISNESPENLTSIEYWQRLIHTYCMPTSIFRISTAATLPSSSGIFSHGAAMKPNLFNVSFLDANLDTTSGVSSKFFELTTAFAARFFVTNVIIGNVAKFYVALPGLKFQVMNNGSIFLISRLQQQYIYNDGSIANLTGNVKLVMNRDLRIESVDIQYLSYQPSISFPALEAGWKLYMESKSKEMNKGPYDSKEFLSQIHRTAEAIRNTPGSGMHENVMRILQVGDVMSQLKPLMGFSTINSINSPLKSLELFLATNNQQAQGQLQAAAGVQQHSAQQQQKSASSPSPHTVHSEDPKLKKRRLSSVQSADGNKRRK